jgi:hypothetical protein
MHWQDQSDLVLVQCSHVHSQISSCGLTRRVGDNYIQVLFLGISPALLLRTLKINTSELSTVDLSNLNIFVRASLVSN